MRTEYLFDGSCCIKCIYADSFTMHCSVISAKLLHPLHHTLCLCILYATGNVGNRVGNNSLFNLAHVSLGLIDSPSVKPGWRRRLNLGFVEFSHSHGLISILKFLQIIFSISTVRSMLCTPCVLRCSWGQVRTVFVKTVSCGVVRKVHRYRKHCQLRGIL